jgi:hypothetical protein
MSLFDKEGVGSLSEISPNPQFTVGNLVFKN